MEGCFEREMCYVWLEDMVPKGQYILYLRWKRELIVMAQGTIELSRRIHIRPSEAKD